MRTPPAAAATPRAAPHSAAGPWTATGTIPRAGGEIGYAMVGAKTDQPPLVLLHKLGGWIADWRDVATALSLRRRVIAFDLPGHGTSRWQGDPPQVQTVLETAALIHGALLDMGLKRTDLAGTSLGGCVAVAMTAIAPERVRKLALPCCVLGPASTLDQVRQKEQAQAAMFTPDGLPLPVGPDIARQVFGLIDAERIGAEQNASRAQAGRWIRPHERGVAFTDFTALMPRVTAPTLLLYGARDTFFLKYRAGAEAAFPDVRTVVLPDASGFPVQDNPRETARELARFFDG
jgi:pimeloyl-ACP methyl ester carboxylesterase